MHDTISMLLFWHNILPFSCLISYNGNGSDKSEYEEDYIIPMNIVDMTRGT